MHTNQKLISIIIPTYGRSKYLIRAIESVLNQSYSNFEIIIVDDNGRGSKHQLDTYNKIHNILKEDKRVKYIIHDKNMNGSAARNTGIRNAKGEYICFLDDDDEFLEDKLLSQYKLLETLDTEWIACYTGHTRYFDGNIEKNYNYEPKIQGYILLDVLSFSVDVCSGSTLMIRKDVLLKVKGFNEELKRHQDYEFIAKVAYYGKIAVIPKPLVRIHVHLGSYRQKSFDEIEKTRLDYMKFVEPYLVKLNSKEKKIIKFENYYWLLKRSLFSIKFIKAMKYFILCGNILLTIQKLFEDTIKFLKKRVSLNE